MSKINNRNLEELFRGQHLTTKTDLIDAVDLVKTQLAERQQTDLKHSAAYYHALNHLLDSFLASIRKTVLFERLEDNWFYRIKLMDDGARVDLDHVAQIALDEDGRTGGTVDQTFTLIHEQAKLFTPEEYAEAYGVLPSTVRQWIRRGKLRNAKKIGREWKIPYTSDPRRRQKYEPALYVWHSDLAGLPDEYVWLNRHRRAIFSRPEDRCYVFDVQLEGGSGKPVVYHFDGLDRERLELFLMAHPDVTCLGDPAAKESEGIVYKGQGLDAD